ncbi:MAG: UDP-3-O-(3-hydroxymyristoyl)glucosamine N-acyltransferase [Candidatus Dependentiae bacterium]|jgi:UDP-3-O-[3-hydroxymyristoyl] glucosamine N-acyltransferase
MKVHASLKQLCEVVKGATSLDHSFFVEQLTSLEKAGPTDIAVILDRGDGSPFDNVAKSQIEQSNAGLLIAKEAVVPGKAYLLVDDPLHALSQLAAFAAQQDAAELISPHAHISSDATLAEGVRVGAGAVIEAGAQIGPGTHIHPRVFIGRDCTVGAQSIIHSGAVIGSDGFGYQVTKTGMRKIPQTGRVIIGNQVEIGANCTIDRATFDATVIEDGVKMDNLIHIAHNVRIGAATAILAQTGIAGGAVIGRGCQIGGQVAIKDHVTISDGARIVSKSAIMKDIAPRQTVCGQPAISFREWKKQQVVLSGLADHAQKVRRWLQDAPTLSWWQRLWLKLKGR